MFNYCASDSLPEDKTAFQISFQLLASALTKLIFDTEERKKLSNE